MSKLALLAVLLLSTGCSMFTVCEPNAYKLAMGTYRGPEVREDNFCYPIWADVAAGVAVPGSYFNPHYIAPSPAPYFVTPPPVTVPRTPSWTWQEGLK